MYAWETHHDKQILLQLQELGLLPLIFCDPEKFIFLWHTVRQLSSSALLTWVLSSFLRAFSSSSRSFSSSLRASFIALFSSLSWAFRAARSSAVIFTFFAMSSLAAIVIVWAFSVTTRQRDGMSSDTFMCASSTLSVLTSNKITIIREKLEGRGKGGTTPDSGSLLRSRGSLLRVDLSVSKKNRVEARRGC